MGTVWNWEISWWALLLAHRSFLYEVVREMPHLSLMRFLLFVATLLLSGVNIRFARYGGRKVPHYVGATAIQQFVNFSELLYYGVWARFISQLYFVWVFMCDFETKFRQSVFDDLDLVTMMIKGHYRCCYATDSNNNVLTRVMTTCHAIAYVGGGE